MLKKNIENHPIQLRDIAVHRLSIAVNDVLIARDYEGEVLLKLNLGRSEYAEGDTNISIGLRALVEPMPSNDLAESDEQQGDRNPPAFSVEVELHGHFTVDYSKFEFEHLKSWGRINAPFILLPFVREQVYGLAIRAGIKGLVFPLFIQPGSGPKAKQVHINQDNS